MNVYTFSGNIGSNAEMRATKSGTELCQFSVAVNSGYGDRKKTMWVKCTMFGKRGQSLAPYLLKGSKVVVSGEASLNEWEGKNGTRTDLEVNVNDVTLVDSRQQGSQSQSAPAQTSAHESVQDGFEDSDIPF
jgi:single-strand DNA-binding protein